MKTKIDTGKKSKNQDVVAFEKLLKIDLCCIIICCSVY